MSERKNKLARKVTLKDIAREAGVGAATVDRYLNSRSQLKQTTVDKIQTAMKTLNFQGASQFRPPAMVAGKTIRIGMIVPRVSGSIYEMLTTQISQRMSQHYQQEVVPVMVDCDIRDLNTVSATIIRLAKEVDVLGMVVLDDPQVKLAISKAAETGARIFTLFSPLSHSGQIAHIGLDDRKAGRAAAWLAQRLTGNQLNVAIFQGNNRFLCQEDCESSFRSWFREQNLRPQITGPLHTLEDVRYAEIQTNKLLLEHPELNLIYAPCGGVGGIIDSLRNHPRKDEIFMICHGPFVGWEQALVDGTVDVIIYQDLTTICDLIARLLDEPAAQPGVVRYLPLEFSIKIRESL